MRILFTSPHTLLDPASGAAHSVQTLLSRLARRGHEVLALTGSVQDGAGAPGAFSGLRVATLGDARRVSTGVLGGVEHRVLHFADSRLRAMTVREESALYQEWQAVVADWRPDAVLTFGGLVYNRLVLADARARGIRTAFYLAAPGYRERASFDDADVVFAVSAAAARENGLAGDPRVRLISSVLELDRYRVVRREPTYVVFVNPQAAKGLAVFAAVAELSERLGRPHRFLVVESRGTWAAALASLPSLRARRNVTVWPRQDDMRSVYRFAHTVIFPSLWFEAAGRVLREAGVNGIPVVAHRVGGVEETVPDGLVLLDPPTALLDDWMAAVPAAFAAAWLAELDRLHEDGAHYARQSDRIRATVEAYSLDALVSRVEDALREPLCAHAAGPNAADPAGGAGGPGAEGGALRDCAVGVGASAPGTDPASARTRILFTSSACLLDTHSEPARRTRTLLEALAARGHDVRVLCGSILSSPGAGALLDRTPVSGRWTGGAAGPHGSVRGGVFRGVRYRVVCFASSRLEDHLAKESQTLFLACLDVERTWAPQALLVGGDDLFARLLLQRARSRARAALGWPPQGDEPRDAEEIEAVLGIARPSA